MQFKKLTLHNIASIADATIDFEHGPLAHDSRFLICGPTGTGKTTLLDAICLALYCTTPRLRASAKESYADPVDSFANGSRDEISVDDSRMLMRRGARDAAVHLEFTDKDDVPLCAVWSCRRSHNRADGTIQSCEWYLCDEHGVVVAKKTKSMREEIPRRIGLTFEQFCRTTLLAQGDFTKFLKSGESEKAEILEKLTGTEIYSEISRQIHQRFGQKEEACRTIREQLGGVQLLSPDEQAALQEQIAALQTQREKAAHEELQHQTVVNWWQHLSEAQAAVKQTEDDVQLCRQQTASEEFVAQQQLLSDWDQSTTLRGQWEERNQWQMKLQELEREEEQLRERYAQLSGGQALLQQTLQQLQTEAAEVGRDLEAHQAQVPVYQQVNVIASLLQQQGLTRQHIATAVQQLEQWDKQLVALHQQQEELKPQLQEKELRREECRKAYEAGKQLLEQWDYEALLQQQTAGNSQLEKLSDYAHRWDKHEQQQTLVAQTRAEQEEGQRQLALHEKEVAEAQRQLEQLEHTRQSQDAVLRKQQMACADLMKEYRKNLSVGDTCPLCGQPIDHLHSDADFQSVLEPLETALRQLDEQLQQVKDRKFAHAAMVDQHRRQLKKTAATLEDAQTNLAALTTQLSAGEWGTRYFSAAQPRELMAADRQQLEQSLQAVGAQLKAFGQQQRQVQTGYAQLDTATKSVQEVQQRLTALEKKEVDLTSRRAAEARQLQQERERLQQSLAELDAIVPAADREREGAHFLDNLRTAAQHYQQQLDRRQVLEREVQQRADQLQQIAQIQQEMRHPDIAWPEADTAAPAAIQQLLQQWIQFRSAEAVHRSTLAAARQSWTAVNEVLQTYFSAPDAVITTERLLQLLAYDASQIEELRGKHQQHREQLLQLQTLAQQAATHLQQHLAARPEMPDAMTAETAALQLQTVKDQLMLCDQRLGELRQQSAQDAANQKRFEQILVRLQAAEAESVRWGKLHELFGSSDGKKFRNIAQSYVLGQLLINANQYLRQFTDRYAMLCQPGSLTILLRDHEAGGITRPTTTISGGEGFLISLSLALGLSSLSRASISMDTLFIDEGFGTLDATYLSAVMDALERLHQMGGKRVGIISHVESLKDRITTQIQVSRVNGTLSRVDVVTTL